MEQAPCLSLIGRDSGQITLAATQRGETGVMMDCVSKRLPQVQGVFRAE